MCGSVQLGKPSHRVVRRSSVLIGRCSACLSQARMRTGGCHRRACGCARVRFRCAAAVAAAGRACSHHCVCDKPRAVVLDATTTHLTAEAV